MAWFLGTTSHKELSPLGGQPAPACAPARERPAAAAAAPLLQQQQQQAPPPPTQQQQPQQQLTAEQRARIEASRQAALARRAAAAARAQAQQQQYQPPQQQPVPWGGTPQQAAPPAWGAPSVTPGWAPTPAHQPWQPQPQAWQQQQQQQALPPLPLPPQQFEGGAPHSLLRSIFSSSGAPAGGAPPPGRWAPYAQPHWSPPQQRQQQVPRGYPAAPPPPFYQQQPAPRFEGFPPVLPRRATGALPPQQQPAEQPLPPPRPSPGRKAPPKAQGGGVAKRRAPPPPKGVGKGYGPGTAFVFHAAPAGAPPPKKLAQSTLVETMTKWRAGKEGGKEGKGAGAPPSPRPAAGDTTDALELDAGADDGSDFAMPWGGQQQARWLVVAGGAALASPAAAPRTAGAPDARAPAAGDSTFSDGAAPSPLGGGARTPRPLPQRQPQAPARSVAAAPPPPPSAGAAAAREPQALRARAQAALCAPPADADGGRGAAGAARWPWLADRRDAAGRRPDDPAFDARTLLIPKPDLAALRGFHRQYWDIKRGLMDVVLFVRVGSFYELYDADADVGLRVGLRPMGGSGAGDGANMWRCGCAAPAFDAWAARVLALGRPVGRVEEVHGARSADGRLVARRLVRVYTPGTVLEGAALDGAGGAPAPLLALFEGGGGELGGVLVDAPGAALALGAWREADAPRSVLAAALAHANVAEAVALPGGLSADTAAALARHRVLAGDGTERPLALSRLRGALPLPAHPDAPGAAPRLLLAARTAWAAGGGAPGALAAGSEAAAFLAARPHAAAALLVAVRHLVAVGAAAAVLPAASLRPLPALGGGGGAATGHMLLDAAATRALELVAGSLGGPAGSLAAFLAAPAATAAGRRRVRTWVTAPLFRVGDIEERLDAVAALMGAPEAAGAFQAALRGAPDAERLLPRAAALLAAVAGAVDRAVEQRREQQEEGLEELGGDAALEGPPPDGDGDPAVAAAEHAAGAAVLSQAAFLPVVRLFEGLGMMLQATRALQEGLAASGGGGGAPPPALARAAARGAAVAAALAELQRVFHADRFQDAAEDVRLEEGLDGRLDAAAADADAARAALGAALEAERARLLGAGAAAPAARRARLVAAGDGLLLEVPQALKELAVAGGHALIRETKTVARFRVAAVAAAEAALGAARDAARGRVLAALAAAARLFLGAYPAFAEFVGAVASLDALAALAEATHPDAAPPGCAFSRPRFAAAEPPVLRLRGVWSPQLLAAARAGGGAGGGPPAIRPNDLLLGGAGAPPALVLTGANAGGKSTLLRSACLAAVMAQVGCYVPCADAELSPVDRVFARMGAGDRLARGESTFQVEVAEAAATLRHAGRASLVVLDELGRGTCARDGGALAGAALAHLARATRCRTLFATHHHGLAAAPELAGAAAAAHMVTELGAGGREARPTYALAPGPAPHGSCGAALAGAAGLPAAVVGRALALARALAAAHGRGEGAAAALAAAGGELQALLGRAREAAAGGGAAAAAAALAVQREVRVRLCGPQA